jgi:hypothetical protein
MTHPCHVRHQRICASSMTRLGEKRTNYEEAMNNSSAGHRALLSRGGGHVNQLRATREYRENSRPEISRGEALQPELRFLPLSRWQRRDACCQMMSGPPLLPAVLRMNGKAFHDEVYHVGETKKCADRLLDLSSADVEAVRNYLLELSGQARPN